MRLPLILGLLLAALAPLLASELACWHPDSTTQVLENGNCWQNPLNQRLGKVVVRDPLTGAQPGRYCLTFRARTEKAAPCQVIAAAWEGDNAALPTAVAPVGIAATDTPTQWSTVILQFDIRTGIPVTLGVLNQGWNPAASGWLQIDTTSLRLEPLNLPLSIARARVTKIRYTHHESGAVALELTNTGDQPRAVTVRSTITDEDDLTTTGLPQRVTLPPHATRPCTAPFHLPKSDGGYAVSVELRAGATIVDTRDADVFCVSDSPFLFENNTYGGFFPYVGPAAHGLGINGLQTQVLDKWDAYARQCVDAVEQLRRSYGTAHEFFAWAREDALFLAEQSDAPYLAGQCAWVESRKQFVLLNRLMRDQGISPFAYVNSVVFGWPGMAMMQQRPEWFIPRGATYSTKALEMYNHGEWPNAYCCLPTVFDKPSPIDGKTFLDYHLEQLRACAKAYGFEVFRYDAGPLPRQYVPRVVQSLRKLNPPAYIGTNYACVYAMDSETVAMRKAYCTDGSMMMDEAIGFAWLNAGNPYRKWTNWLSGLRHSADLVRANGGHFSFINLYGNWYANSVGYASGGHPYHGAYQCPYGNTARFMIRYGYYFWDLRTQLYDHPESVLTVAAPHPVWWKPFVSQRKLTSHHRQLIVPFFNPPTGEDVTDTTIPAKAEGVTVTFKPEPGETVNAWLLTAEPTARRESLPTTVHPDGRIDVAVPSFWAWTNVVFDCRR